MAITHALVGAMLAIPFFLYSHELAIVVLLAGILGGFFPDLDLYFGHRKTLHYPIYYSIVGALLGIASFLVPSTILIVLTVFLLAAALHSLMDILGGGLELRPWEGKSDQAVYDHVRNKWIAPRRIVPYDGSPEDLFLSVALAVPLLMVVDGIFHYVIGGLLVIGMTYSVLRKPLATAAERLAARIPTIFHPYLPRRYYD